jgi:hypothetical protein
MYLEEFQQSTTASCLIILKDKDYVIRETERHLKKHLDGN